MKKAHNIYIRTDVKKALKLKAVKDDITMIDLVDAILVEALEVERN